MRGLKPVANRRNEMLAQLEVRTDIRAARKSPRSAPTFWVIAAVVVAFALLCGCTSSKL